MQHRHRLTTRQQFHRPNSNKKGKEYKIMMAQPIYTANPVAAIVGPQYCAPYPVDLVIVRKVLAITDGNFTVTDVNGKLLFKVKEPVFSLHDRRVLVDAAGVPVLTLREKMLSAHDRWQVFRGESTDTKDLVFTLKRNSMLQLKANLNVYLANNTKQDVSDFKVKGSWLERSSVIYGGHDCSAIVAQMHKKHTAQSLLLGKDQFMVTVYPHVDYAFIVALIVILDDINREDSTE